MQLSELRIEILRYLLEAKERGEPFQYMQHTKRNVLIIMRKHGAIFCSKGNGIDLDRYCITSYGIALLQALPETEKRFFFNDTWYKTIADLARGESMTYGQACYAVRRGYTSRADYAHGGEVTVYGKTYQNRTAAANALNCSPDHVSELIKQEQQGKAKAKRLPVIKGDKRRKMKEAFERLGISTKGSGASNENNRI